MEVITEKAIEVVVEEWYKTTPLYEALALMVVKAQYKHDVECVTEILDVVLWNELNAWIYDYKDAVERNALAEDPDESADYLISLIKEVLKLESEL